MSQKIEERVVQMKFDNDEFEKHAKTTMETLDKLDKKLDFSNSSKGLTSLQIAANSFNLSGVISEIENVGRKYSWLEQIAIGAYRKIGQSAINYLSSEVLNITGINQAINGWKKYESEVESVQTIMNATDLGISEVEKYLKKLSWYTDETSYKYADMVSNIAAFNSAGIKDLGSATDAMMGIANMAGFFGVNATKATHAMEGFAKAMGQSYMDNRAWSYIHTAGMDTAKIKQAFIDTAVALGKIKKDTKKVGWYIDKAGHSFTAESFNTMLKDRWLDQKVMIETFKKYSASMDTIYNAWLNSGETATVSELIDELGDSIDNTTRRAFKASQEAKTFTDVVGSLEEVVSSGWRQSFKYIFGNYEEARDMWTNVVNELWDIFAGAGYKRNDLLKGWYEGDGRKAFLEGMANMWYGVLNIIQPIKKAFDELFPGTTVQRLIDLTNKFKDATAVFKSWFQITDPSENNLTETIKETEKQTESFNDACKRTRKEVKKLAQEVIRGDWGNGWERWKKLGKAGYVWQEVQNEVNAWYNANRGTNYAMHKVTDDGTLKKRKKTVEVEKEIVTNANKITASQLLANRRADNLYKTMKGVFAVVALVKDVFSQIGKTLGDIVSKTVKKLSPTFDAILRLTGKWGDSISRIYDKLTKNKSISKFFDNAAEIISSAIAGLVNSSIPKLMKWLGNITDFVTRKVIPAITTVYNVVKDIITNLWLKLTSGSGFTKLKGSLSTLWEIAKQIAGAVAVSIGGLATSLWDKFEEFVRKATGATEKMTVGEVIATVVDYVAGKISDLIGHLDTAKQSLFDFFGSFDTKKTQQIEKVSENISSASSSIGTTIDTVLSPIKDVFQSILDALTWFGNLLEHPVKTITGLITHFVENVIGLFDGLTIEKLGKGILDSGIGVFFGVLAKNIASGAFSIASIPTGINRILDGIYGVAVAYQNKINAGQIKTMAEAIGILVLAIIGISAADIDWQKVSDFTVNASMLMLAAGAMFKGLAALKSVGKKVVEGAKAFENVKITDNAFAVFAKNIVSPFANFADGFVKALNKKWNGGKFAKSVLAFATAIGIIFLVIRQIRNENWDLDFFDDQGNLTQFGKIGTFVAIIAAALGAFSLLGDNNQTIGAALSFITAVIALKMVIDTIKEVVKDWDEQTFKGAWRVIAVMGAIFAEIVAAVYLTSRELTKFSSSDGLFGKKMSKNTATGGSPMGIAMAVLAYAAAIRIMSPAIKEISTLPNVDNFAGVLFMLGLILAEMVGLSLVLAKAEKGGADIKNAMKTMNKIARMALVMTVVFTAIGMLSRTDGAGENVAAGLIMTASAIAIFAGAAYLLCRFGLDEKLLKIGTAMSSFSKGLLLSAAAVAVFALALPTIVDGIVYLGHVMNDEKLRSDLTEGLATIIWIIIGAIILSKSQILDALGILVKAVFDWAIAIATPLFTKFCELVSLVTKLLQNNKFVLGFFVLVVIGILLDTFEDLVPTIVDKLFAILTKVFYIMAKTINNRGFDLLKSMWTFLKSLVALLFQGLAEIFEEFWPGNEFSEMVRDEIDYMNKQIDKELSDLEDKNDRIKALADDEKRRNKQTGRKRSTTTTTEEAEVEVETNYNVKDVVTSGLDTLTSSGYLSTIFTNGKSLVGKGVEEMWSSVDPTIKETLGISKLTAEDGINKLCEVFPQAAPLLQQNVKETTQKATETAVATIEESKPTVTETIEATANDGLKVIENKKEETVTATKQGIVDPTVETIEGSKPEVEQAVTVGILEGHKNTLDEYKPIVEETSRIDIRDATISGLDGLDTEMSKRMDNAILGFAKAARKQENQNAIWSAGSGVAKQFLKAYDVTSATESPSREMMWRGDMAILGLINGIYSKMANVASAGVSVANTLLDSVSTTLDSSMDLTPTITPVMDMSNVTASTSTLNTLLSSPRMSSGLVSNIGGMTANLSSMLASDAFSGFNQNQLNQQNVTETVNAQNADVVAALGLLRGDVNALNDSFANTQVVLDSGALVGATARQMDNALGRFNVYKKRGI